MDGLQLPIDSRTLESSLTSRKLRAIDVDGSLVYEETDTSDNRLTERLGRVWDEYPNGLLDLTEAKLAGLDPDARAVEEVTELEEEEEDFDRSKPMTYHDMQKARDGLCDQLNTARNELWFALELAKTLSVSSEYTSEPPPHPHQTSSNTKTKKTAPVEASSATKGEPPILPAGSYTATPAAIPVKTHHAQILDYEIALAAKHQALDECSALIDAAVEELNVMSEAGDRFWRDVRQLKDGKAGMGRWAVVPKPDFTRTMAAGEKAKDIVMPYAIDEASSSSRLRCLAAFDLDPAKKEHLTFGSRGHRRLRVTLQTDMQATSSDVPLGTSTDIHEDMQAAQLEALDEDLYTELQNEVSRLPSGTATASSATLKIGTQSLTWEMVDTRVPIPSAERSALCDAIALAARLSILQAYRRRKTRIIGQSAAGTPILQPIIQLLQFHSAHRMVESVLNMHLDLLIQAGIEVHSKVHHPWGDDDGSESLERILAGQAGVGGTSATFILDIANCRGVTVRLSSPSTCRVTTSVAEFAVPDLNDLSSILAEDLAKQILLDSRRVLADATTEQSRADIFFDELEEVVRLPQDATLQLSIPPPYSGLRALIEGSMNETYDSSNDTPLAEWLRKIATKISSSSA